MNIKHLTITEILAIWGAVISTVALGWNIIKSCKEKRELRVHAAIGFKPYKPEDKTLIIHAVNPRKRPINIEGIKIRFNKINVSDFKQKGILPVLEEKKNILSIFLPGYLPKELREGQEESFDINYEPFKDNLVDISNISILDSTGKLWSAKKKALNKLLESFNPSLTRLVTQKARNSQ